MNLGTLHAHIPVECATDSADSAQLHSCTLPTAGMYGTPYYCDLCLPSKLILCSVPKYSRRNCIM